MSEHRADYDSPWKEALERYFEAFMAFFFLALVFAAWTSLISMIELATRVLVDAGIPRSRAIWWVGGVGWGAVRRGRAWRHTSRCPTHSQGRNDDDCRRGCCSPVCRLRWQ